MPDKPSPPTEERIAEIRALNESLGVFPYRIEHHPCEDDSSDWTVEDVGNSTHLHTYRRDDAEQWIELRRALNDAVAALDARDAELERLRAALELVKRDTDQEPNERISYEAVMAVRAALAATRWE